MLATSQGVARCVSHGQRKQRFARRGVIADFGCGHRQRSLFRASGYRMACLAHRSVRRSEAGVKRGGVLGGDSDIVQIGRLRVGTTAV